MTADFRAWTIHAGAVVTTADSDATRHTRRCRVQKFAGRNRTPALQCIHRCTIFWVAHLISAEQKDLHLVSFHAHTLSDYVTAWFCSGQTHCLHGCYTWNQTYAPAAPIHRVTTPTTARRLPRACAFCHLPAYLLRACLFLLPLPPHACLTVGLHFHMTRVYYTAMPA